MRRKSSAPHMLPFVVRAVQAMQETRGSTGPHIVEHVRRNARISPRDSQRYVTAQIKLAIRYGVDAGLLRQEAGRYTLDLTNTNQRRKTRGRTSRISHGRRMSGHDMDREQVEVDAAPSCDNPNCLCGTKQEPTDRKSSPEPANNSHHVHKQEPTDRKPSPEPVNNSHHVHKQEPTDRKPSPEPVNNSHHVQDYIN